MKRMGWLGLVLTWGSLAVADENAVRNSGFEATDASGATVGWSERRPVYRFEAGCGRDGSRGWRTTMPTRSTIRFRRSG
jgi:hypothetical protein